ncbi:hypothetical protein [Bradyrhizobium sp. STM 3557]|uniref:hypothetical protein n=1 Tax=Bradyrhizobium sp. STM 3557 TaxID=578920 RepID=UPI00389093AE
MKRAAFLFAVALAIVQGIAPAQGADDPKARIRVCSPMERADQLECMDKLSHAVALPAAPRTDGWVISQTSSPVDYSPIATATIASRDGVSGRTMQLSIRCRGGRAELAVAGAGISDRGEDYVASYRINGGQPVQFAAGVAAFSDGVAFKGDAVSLIRSLPSEGELALHLSPRVGTAKDGIFPLAGLDAVRAKIAVACKWPHAIAKPTYENESEDSWGGGGR